MKLFLAPEYKSLLGLPSSGAERIDFWKGCADKLGARYISFWARGEKKTGDKKESVVLAVGCTLPLIWQIKYLTGGMAQYDPEIVLGLESSEALVFDYNTFDDKRFEKFTTALKKVDLGMYAITIPEHYNDGFRSITSFTFDSLPPADSDERAELVIQAKQTAAEIADDTLSHDLGISLPRTKLTAREMTVLSLIADGKTHVEIGAILDIGEETVVSHIDSSKAKLGARTTSEAITKAFNLDVT